MYVAILESLIHQVSDYGHKVSAINLMEDTRKLIMKVKCSDCKTTFRTNCIYAVLNEWCPGCSRQKQNECIEIYCKGERDCKGSVTFDYATRSMTFEIEDEDIEYKLSRQLCEK